MPISFDPFASDWRRDPYPVYRRLRDEAPVHYSAEREIYSVTRYDDVMRVLRTPDLFSSRAMFTMLMSGGSDKLPPLSLDLVRFLARMAWKTRMNPFEFQTARNLIAEDGESHAKLRAIVNRGFTPKRIESWEGRAREIVESCVEPLRRGQPFDVVTQLAIPLPVTLIAEMLGVPAERHADFKRWSDMIIDFSSGPGRDDPFSKKYRLGFSELMVCLKELVKQRRSKPEDDLVSVIVAEQDGEAGLSVREVIQFVMLLMAAGNETTTNLIGNLVNALLDHPEQAEKVANDPSLVPDLVEEGLRYDAPVQLVFRTTTRDTELRGTKIPEGSFVAAYLGSANRDERRFEAPDRLDVTRKAQPFPGFGFGKHFCLGASLARLEARVALEAILPQFPGLVRSGGPVSHVDSFFVRGPRRLELKLAA